MAIGSSVPAKRCRAKSNRRPLYDLPEFHATIGGFSAGDTFDLGGFAYDPGETLSFTEAASLASGTLSVVDGGLSAQLTLLGSYVTSDFALADDNRGGTLVSIPQTS